MAKCSDCGGDMQDIADISKEYKDFMEKHGTYSVCLRCFKFNYYLKIKET